LSVLVTQLQNCSHTLARSVRCRVVVMMDKCLKGMYSIQVSAFASLC